MESLNKKLFADKPDDEELMLEDDEDLCSSIKELDLIVFPSEYHIRRLPTFTVRENDLSMVAD